MKIYLHENLPERIKDITGKRLENMSVYTGNTFLADKNSSIDIKDGVYTVNLKIEYTDGSIDILEGEKLWVSLKDVKVTVNYKKFSDVVASRMNSPLFWIGVITSIFGIGLLILVIAFYFSDRSKYYEKNGCSILVLRTR